VALKTIKQATKQSKQTIQYPKEEFEDTKQVIRSLKAKKTRQYNGQAKKDKQRSAKHDT
jgi:hypothetical protein